MAAQFSYRFGKRARLKTLAVLLALVSRGLRPIWAIGAAARPQRAAKTRQLEPRQHERRPVQAVDPADRAAEAAVLPRFPAEISLTPRECAPFTYRNGALHAEDVALATIAEAVGTPFYCYSSAAIEGEFRGVSGRVRRPERAHFLCDEGQFKPGGADDAGRARRRHGRGQRGGTETRPGGGRAGRAHHLLGRRQDAGRDEPWARREYLLLQRRVGAGTGGALARRPRLAAPLRRSPSASIPTSMRAPTPRSRPASRRTSSACRSPAPATSTPTRAPCRA